MDAKPVKFEPLANQPEQLDFVIADDIFVKAIRLEKAGTVMPQHAHTYDHATMIATGRVKIWADDKFLGEFAAPAAVLVKANTKHTFQSIEPDTLVYCIHSIHRTGVVEIAKEHQIEGAV